MIPEEKKLEILEFIYSGISTGSTLKDLLVLAAKKFKLKQNCLHSLYYRNKRNGERSHGNSILSKDESHILEAVLISFSAVSMPLAVRRIRQLIFFLWKKEVSPSWAYTWIGRKDKTLKLGLGKPMNKKRLTDEIIENIDTFCEVIQNRIKILKLNDFNCVNYDETRIVTGKDGGLKVFIKQQMQNNCTVSKYRAYGSYVPFVSAEGRVLMSVLIFPSPKKNKETFVLKDISLPTTDQTTRSSWPHYIVHTQSGYLDRDLFRKLITEFCRIWQLNYPGYHCYLFGDQLPAHMDPVSIAHSWEKQVFLMYLPANTSHFLQPLDNLCFANFKQKVHDFIDYARMKSFFVDDDEDNILREAIYDAEVESFTKDVITKSFSNCGIFPFDPEKIHHLTQINRGNFEKKDDGEVGYIVGKIKNSIVDSMDTVKKKKGSIEKPI